MIGNWSFLDNYSHACNGRIWILFDSRRVDVKCLVVGDQFIHCEVTWHATCTNVIITFVYAMNEAIERESLWLFLKSFTTTKTGKDGGFWMAVQ